jgi:hypothetical protein
MKPPAADKIISVDYKVEMASGVKAIKLFGLKGLHIFFTVVG